MKIVGGKPSQTPQQWFRVSYDETTLFLMVMAGFLLGISNPVFRSDIGYILGLNDALLNFLLLSSVLIGAILAVIHPFTNREKNDFEKLFMTIFVLVANGGSGLYAGILMFAQTDRRYFIFPLINIFSFYFIFIAQVVADSSRSISDENANSSEVFAWTMVLLLIFMYCTYLQIHWATTFSICVAYATMLRDLFKKLLIFARSKTLPKLF